MSSAHPIPRIKLDLTPTDYRLVTRALMGKLSGAEIEEADNLARHLFRQYVSQEEERSRRLRVTLNAMEKEIQEANRPDEDEVDLDPPGDPKAPVVTYLRPGSVLGNGRMGHGKPANYESSARQ